MHRIDSIRRNDDSNEAVVICDGEYFRIIVQDLENLGVEEDSLIDDKDFECLLEASRRLSCIKKSL